MKAVFLVLAAALTCALATVDVGAQCSEVFTTGLKAPAKMLITARGTLIVSEAGEGPNTGRVSIVGPDGVRRTLVDGLPSGINAVGEPSGPWGLAMSGSTLFVTIGEGDISIPGTAEGSAVANPSPSSPLFSTVLSIRLTPRIERKTQGFSLTADNQAALATGQKVRLKGRGKDRLVIERIVDFPDFEPDPIPDEPANIRTSNPFGIVVDGDRIYVADAALNSVHRVSAAAKTFETLARFDPQPNPLPFGPPFVDAVPTNVRLDGGSIVVPLLTGFPFPGGTSEVRAVDPETGASSTLIGGLSTAIDVLPNGGGGYFVLEFSADILGGAPGVLLEYETPGGTPVVVADCLVTPANMVRAGNGDVYVTELFAGQIVRVSAP